MFVDSLLHSSPVAHSRRGWTTVASFALQALVVAAVLAVPFISTEHLSPLRLTAPVQFVPAPPRLHSSSAAPQTANSARNSLPVAALVAPAVIPQHLPPTEVLAEVALGEIKGLPLNRGGGGSANAPGVENGLGIEPVAPPPPDAPAKPPRVSRMMEGNLIDRVVPQYPRLAVMTRVQGQVILRAVISRQGTIESVQVVSGHPLLVQSALEAVRRWRYRPYILNDEPVEVDTQIVVNFDLSGR